MRRTAWISPLVSLTLLAAGCAKKEAPAPSAAAPAAPAAAAPANQIPIAPDVSQRLAKFSRTHIEADVKALSHDEREVVRLLVEASKPLDEIFQGQVWSGNAALRATLPTLAGPHADDARALFKVMQGPFDRLDQDKPFLGTATKPEGAGFYPDDLTKAAYESYLAAHPAESPALRGLYSVVQRQGDKLVAVPYSQAYRAQLEASAAKLREAAGKTGNASLKKFLETRAAAFLSDDYYESDMAWMDLDSPVEITIGPYENYEDGLMGDKAAFETFVTVALPEESKALAVYKERLPWLEHHLPIPEEHKNMNRGSESPIRVVDSVYAAGDGNRGVQTIAFNLPNDERVREAKGSKKVLLRNVIRAKYDKILVPIAERVMPKEEVEKVSFDAFFNEVLQHELGHGLGPGTITKDGKKTEVRKELKELFSPLEEAKADVMGVYNIIGLIGAGSMPRTIRDALEATYVAGLFRSARFGAHEAHGKGVVSQFNYLLEKGALAVDAQGRFRSVPDKFEGAISDLLHDMLMLQANGDYEGTKAFLDKYGVVTKELDAAIAKIQDVPTDIIPDYVGAK
jgi:hypothetical protein